MKTHYFFYSLFFFGMISSFAQNFQGIATYKTHREVNLKMDSTSVNKGMQEQIQAQLRKQFQKEYTLSFTPFESLYQQIEHLDTPIPSAGNGVQIKVSGTSDLIYKDVKKARFTQETEIMGKEFLIKDTLVMQDWKLEKASKNIGEYTCFKATFTEEVTEETFSDTSDAIEKITKLRTTTAWYTPQIPVQHGPDSYWGLPGLILEINDGGQTILCTKIVLNPKETVSITIPNTGKEVTQDVFDEIQEKKTKEMMEVMRNNRTSKDGNSFSIKIGG